MGDVAALLAACGGGRVRTAGRAARPAELWHRIISARPSHGARWESDRTRGGPAEARRLCVAPRQAARYVALGRRPRAVPARTGCRFPRRVLARAARHPLGACIAHAGTLCDVVVLL